MNIPEISIVICFRDWGLDRLHAAVESHFANAAIAGLEIEVIVSDYGSADPLSVVDALKATPARIARTSVDGPWNRSAALNAGIRVANGQWLVTTDADIVFTPATMPVMLCSARANPDALYLVQCRDLPECFGAERVSAMLESGNWSEEVTAAVDRSQIRPRWGMGGFAAFHTAFFSAVNGYEERMQIWGGEDNDFAQRARRAGLPVRWLSASDVAILHVWHEPSQRKAIETVEGKEAVEENRKILREDYGLVRNLPRAIQIMGADPTVTIIIPTYRRAGLLAQAIDSCRHQTFPGWELLVVENGESDVARDVVEAYDDPRIKYLKSPRAGAAAARNFGLDHSRGRYIVIHDDDDIMVSTRVEDHLAALQPGDHGTYGGWIDFDGKTFEVEALQSGKEFSFEAVLCNGRVLTHGAAMLDRRVYSHFRYEESLSAGIDYGFILLLARNGLKLSHTRRFGILRRLHASNMTRVNMAVQKAAGVRMAELVKSEIDPAQYPAFRARGLSVATMECENEAAALGELAAWRRSGGRGAATELNCSNLGANLSEVVASKQSLDEMVSTALSCDANINIDPKGISVAALVFIHLRTKMLMLRRTARLAATRGAR